MRKSTSKALGIVTGSLLLVMTSGVTLAHSKRFSFSDNGHVYQRFDGDITWNSAKAACEQRQGHLATLTSEEENQFVYDKLLDANSGAVGNRYIIGLYESPEYQWNWVTGERWDYNNWASGQPSNSYASYGNVSDRYQNIGTTSADQWQDYWKDSNRTRTGYICEWSKPISIATSNYSDINGDGVDESLILFYDYRVRRPTLYISDMVDGKKLKQVRFGTASTEAKAAISLSDQTGDSWPEAAVLYYNNRLSWLEVIDVKNNQKLNKVLVLEGTYKPLSLSLTADINGNGSEEFIIQGSHNRGFNSTKKSLIEIRDSETGELINSREF